MKQAFIIAEAGVNHCGSLSLAKELIHAAAEAKADAVKFQTFKTDFLITKTAAKAKYQELTTGSNESQSDMLKKLELPFEWHFELKELSDNLNIEFFSTPFDFESLEFLVGTLGLTRVKIPSGDNNNVPFLYRVGQIAKSIILSTGYMTLSDIETSLGAIAMGKRKTQNPNLEPSAKVVAESYIAAMNDHSLKGLVSLLHCTSEYPPSMKSLNLRCMETLRSSFDLDVGLSDHSLGISIPVAAVAMGAIIIEKHFTMNKSLPGPDHQASLDPTELSQMVKGIRDVECALGRAVKHPTFIEQQNRTVAQKSLIAKREIQMGETFSSENLVIKRPGDGIPPKFYWDLIGKKSNRLYNADDKIDMDSF